MKIALVGAGKFGTAIVNALLGGKNDVTVIALLPEHIVHRLRQIAIVHPRDGAHKQAYGVALGRPQALAVHIGDVVQSLGYGQHVLPRLGLHHFGIVQGVGHCRHGYARLPRHIFDRNLFHAPHPTLNPRPG